MAAVEIACLFLPCRIDEPHRDAGVDPHSAQRHGEGTRDQPHRRVAGDPQRRLLPRLPEKIGLRALTVRLIHLALAAYNAGPGAVLRAGGIPRNSETPGYVRSVLERWQAIGSRI